MAGASNSSFYSGIIANNSMPTAAAGMMAQANKPPGGAEPTRCAVCQQTNCDVQIAGCGCLLHTVSISSSRSRKGTKRIVGAGRRNSFHQMSGFILICCNPFSVQYIIFTVITTNFSGGSPSQSYPLPATRAAARCIGPSIARRSE